MGNPIFPVERNSQKAVIAIGIVFSVIPIVACILRALARRIANRALDASDWVLFAACLVAVAYQGVNLTGVFVGGVGFHFAEIMQMYGPGPITLFLKLLIPVQLLWALSLSLCKISILILYTRVFTVRAFVWTAYCTGIIIIMWALATILMGFFLCQPFERNWNQNIPGHCGNQLLSYRITGALNLITDVVVLTLPMPHLFTLNLALYKKLVLVATFAVGIFTCVVSILRLVSLSTIDYSDITYNIPEALIFSALEPCIAVTLACVPVLRPLLGKGAHSATGTALGSAAKIGSSKNAHAFEPLTDDSSQYRLRPLGPKHDAQARANPARSSISASDSDEGVVAAGDAPVTGGRGRAKGIVVRNEWSVASTGDEV